MSFRFYYPKKPTMPRARSYATKNYVIYPKYSRNCQSCNSKIFDDNKSKLEHLFCDSCATRFNGKIKELKICGCARIESSGRISNYGFSNRMYNCGECNNQGHSYK